MSYLGSLGREADKNARSLGCSSTFIVLSLVNNYYICGESMCMCVCICVSVCFPVATFVLGAKRVNLPGDYDWGLIKDIKLYLVTLNVRFLTVVAIL